MPVPNVVKDVTLTLLACLLLMQGNALAESETSHHSYGKHTFSIGPTPDWVKPRKVPRAKGAANGQGQEYALVDTQLNAIHPSNYQRYYRSATYLHTTQAVAEGSEVHIAFNPAYQQLTIHSINVEREGQTIAALSPDIIRLIQREEDLRNGIYDGIITAIAIVPNTRIGDKVDFSYTVTGRNPIFGDKLFTGFSTGWSLDVGRTDIRILAPSERPLHIKIHGSDIKVKKRKRRQYTEYTWTTKGTKGLPNEGDYPPEFQRYGWLQISEFDTWGDVQAWAHSIYESLDNSAKELQTITEELHRTSDDKLTYAANALKFTQDEIRYLGLEFGQNSHLPHPPQEVLEKRYGDCKDKSNLLTQLLRANGIEAHSALVSSEYRAGIADMLPSPAAFDHVIVRARIGGETFWLDPTKTFQGHDIRYIGFTNYGKALIIGDDVEATLQSISAPLGYENSLTSTEHFTLQEGEKSARLQVKTIYKGSLAEYQRYQFSNNSKEVIATQYQSYYSTNYPGIESASSLDYSDDPVSNSVTIIEKYNIPEVSTYSEPYHASDFSASSISQHLAVPQQRIRETPVFIGNPRSATHKIIVDFSEPTMLTIDSTPLILSSNNIDYRARSAFFDNRFEFKAQLEIKDSTVYPQSLAEYLNAITTINDDINFTLTFPKFTREEYTDKWAPRKELINMLKERNDA